jgi:hypothetical protein
MNDQEELNRVLKQLESIPLDSWSEGVLGMCTSIDEVTFTILSFDDGDYTRIGISWPGGGKNINIPDNRVVALSKRVHEHYYTKKREKNERDGSAGKEKYRKSLDQ